MRPTLGKILHLLDLDVLPWIETLPEPNGPCPICGRRVHEIYLRERRTIRAGARVRFFPCGHPARLARIPDQRHESPEGTS